MANEQGKRVNGGYGGSGFGFGFWLWVMGNCLVLVGCRVV